MNTPLVSVILPCYNGEETVSRTVESVLAQTMQSFELIAVDDGSTDGAGALLDRWAGRDARVRVLHTENGGVARARNAGMAAATGKWLAFVDADDVLLPDALSRLLALDDGTAQILCGGFIMRHIDEGNREQPFVCAHGDLQTVLESLIRGDSALNPMYAKLYSLSFVRQAGLCVPPGVKVGEDVLFNLEAFAAATAWQMDDAPVYIYEYGGNSVMTRARADVYGRSLAMLDGIGRFVRAHGMETALFRAHIDIYLRTLRRDRGRFGAAVAMSREMVAGITCGVRAGELCAKQRLYYAALRALPCLSYFLP